MGAKFKPEQNPRSPKKEKCGEPNQNYWQVDSHP